jgi:ribosomal protein S12 methylthiotransferase accessory factor
MAFDNTNGAEAPRLPYCCSAVIAPFQYRGEQQPTFTGEGKGATPEDATRGAIGEGIERYSASIWHPSRLTRKAFNEVRSRAFDPRWLVLYDDVQYKRKDFPFARFDPDQEMFWTTGEWLDTNEPVLLPAIAAYMNFPSTASERFCQTTSNGLAAGSTFNDAALRALYELVERDAFMLFWLARRPGVPVLRDKCDDPTAQALSDVERMGARTELYLIDAGTHLPTIVCLGFGDGVSWPGVTIGLGTHADVDIALRRAVFEHGHYGAYIRRLMQEGRHTTVRTVNDVVAALDHGLYYVHPSHIDSLRFFRSSEMPVRLSELRLRYRQPATLATCVALLSEAGIRTAAVDVTSPDIGLAAIKVVRAFGQHMQPLHFGVGNTRLQNPRLYSLLLGPAEMVPHPVA